MTAPRDVGPSNAPTPRSEGRMGWPLRPLENVDSGRKLAQRQDRRPRTVARSTTKHSEPVSRRFRLQRPILEITPSWTTRAAAKAMPCAGRSKTEAPNRGSPAAALIPPGRVVFAKFKRWLRKAKVRNRKSSGGSLRHPRKHRARRMRELPQACKLSCCLNTILSKLC